MKLSDLIVHDADQPYSLEEMQAASGFYSSLGSAHRLCARIIEDGAGRCGWVDEDGKLRHGWGYLPPGEETGGLHAYETRNVYQQVPNPALVAEYIEGLDSEQRQQYIQQLLEKMRTDWYMSWLRKTPDWEFIAPALSNHPDGYLTVHGDWSLEIRKNPPDEATQETREQATANDEAAKAINAFMALPHEFFDPRDRKEVKP